MLRFTTNEECVAVYIPITSNSHAVRQKSESFKNGVEEMALCVESLHHKQNVLSLNPQNLHKVHIC